jgi:putative glycosyltransferase
MPTGKSIARSSKATIAEMEISVVATLYNSAPYINEFVERSRAALTRITEDFEIVLVDDGSPDDSLSIALSLMPGAPFLKVVELSRNFGHHKAMMTGLEHAAGNLIFLIDVDLEEPPELLGDFLATLKSGEWDVVFGFQKQRKGALLERVGGDLAWRFLNLFLPVKIPHSHSTVRLMTRDYVNTLLLHKEHMTAIGGLWVITGFRQKGVEFEKRSRGKTSYGLGHRLVALLDSITSFSELPLFIIFYTGCIVILGSIVMAAWLIFRRLHGYLLAGWASTIVLLTFFGGLTVFSIGVVGLYVSRIFIETKGRPYTVIRKIHDRG